MGRKRKVAASGGGFDPSNVEGYVSRIESVRGEIDDIMAKAQEKCTALRQTIAEIKKESAQIHSIPRRELNTVLANRRGELLIETRRGNLSKEQQDNYDRMMLALGDFHDTELGEATKARTGAGVAAGAAH